MRSVRRASGLVQTAQRRPTTDKDNRPPQGDSRVIQFEATGSTPAINSSRHSVTPWATASSEIAGPMRAPLRSRIGTASNPSYSHLLVTCGATSCCRTSPCGPASGCRRMRTGHRRQDRRGRRPTYEWHKRFHKHMLITPHEFSVSYETRLGRVSRGHSNGRRHACWRCTIAGSRTTRRLRIERGPVFEGPRGSRWMTPASLPRFSPAAIAF
jgi:hypothetical protein